MDDALDTGTDAAPEAGLVPDEPVTESHDLPVPEAYANFDLTLTRDVVPWINFANGVEQDFFSARIGCQLFQPVRGIDLAALCVRHT